MLALLTQWKKLRRDCEKPHSIASVWNALLTVCDVAPGSDEDKMMQDLLVRGLTKHKKINTLKSTISSMLQSDEAKAVAMVVLQKVIELGITAIAH